MGPDVGRAGSRLCPSGRAHLGTGEAGFTGTAGFTGRSFGADGAGGTALSGGALRERGGGTEVIAVRGGEGAQRCAPTCAPAGGGTHLGTGDAVGTGETAAAGGALRGGGERSERGGGDPMGHSRGAEPPLGTSRRFRPPRRSSGELEGRGMPAGTSAPPPGRRGGRTGRTHPFARRTGQPSRAGLSTRSSLAFLAGGAGGALNASGTLRGGEGGGVG